MRNMEFDAGDMEVYVNGKEIGNAVYAEVEFEAPKEEIKPLSHSFSGTMTLKTGIITRIYKRPDGTVWGVKTFDTGASRIEDCIILGVEKIRDNGLRRRHRAIEQARKEMFRHIIKHEGVEGIINRAVAKWKS